MVECAGIRCLDVAPAGPGIHAGNSGKAREDLKKSIEFLSVLRKIHALFGEDVEATKLKNIIDATKMTLEAEDKSKDKEKKDKDKDSKK